MFGKAIWLKFICSFVVGLLILSWPVSSVSAVETWQQVGGNGLGDPNNTTVVSMESWNGALYAGVGNVVSGARIYRSVDGNNWAQVGTDGFGHAALNQIVDFKSFNGRLYASVEDAALAPGQAGEIWSTANGVTWTQSGGDGLGNPNNTGFYQMEEFGGQLYVGTENGTEGAEIYRTADGTTWNLVPASAAGFGEAGNTVIWSLESFGGWLWAGTANLLGAQVWRSVDGANWVKYFDYALLVPPLPEYVAVNNFSIFSNTLYWFAMNAAGAQIIMRLNDAQLFGSAAGFGDANNIWFSEDVVVSGGYAYFGTRNQTTGGELWYSTDGITGTQIGLDGFGSPNNFALYALAEKDYLYIGFSNNNGIQIWRRYFTSSFVITTKTLPDGQQNSVYSVGLEASEGVEPYVYSLASGALPKGLTLDGASGRISGTPEEAGEFVFTVEVRDSAKKAQRAIRTFSLRIINGVSVSAEEQSALGGVAVLPETGANLN